jgi:RNA 3'-terminal phosphate cyclase
MAQFISFLEKFKMPSLSIQKFSGHNQLRQRLVLATLSSTSIRIDEIRAGEDAPGLAGLLQNLLTFRL